MQVFGWNANGYYQEQISGLAVHSQTYHGWRIDISDHQTAFTFQCYPPDLPDFLDAGEEYPDQETALQEAYRFVDREITIRAMLEVFNAWLQEGLISEDEYWHLTNFE
jgi:hypothetical protein